MFAIPRTADFPRVDRFLERSTLNEGEKIRLSGLGGVEDPCVQRGRITDLLSHPAGLHEHEASTIRGRRKPIWRLSYQLVEEWIPVRAKAGGSAREPGKHQRTCAYLFGANLRQARLRAGLTQAQVAKLTGMQAHYVSTIENGLQNPTLSTMVRVARAVGTDPRTLLKRPSRPI